MAKIEQSRSITEEPRIDETIDLTVADVRCIFEMQMTPKRRELIRRQRPKRETKTKAMQDLSQTDRRRTCSIGAFLRRNRLSGMP